GADWRRLGQQLIGSADGSDANDRASATSIREPGGVRPEESFGGAIVGHEVWRGAGLVVPDRIDLVLWNRTTVRALAWSLLLLSLLIALVLRIAAIARIRLVSTIALAGLAAGMYALPDVY